jgi:LTXXQ motif family protein
MFAQVPRRRHIVGLLLVAAICLSSSGHARNSRHHDNENGRSGSAHQDQHENPTPFSTALEKMLRACRQQAGELKGIAPDIQLRAVQLNHRQGAALERLRSAVNVGAQRLDADCPTQSPGMLSQRIAALDDALKLMADSLHGVRVSLAGFYTSLDTEKAELLLSVNSSSARASASSREKPPRKQAAKVDAGDAERKSKCIEWADALRSWPLNKIESATVLSDFQHARLYELMAAIYRSAGDLIQACPTQERAGPLARLGAKENQLRALRQDIQAVQPFAAAFENGLNAEQKSSVAAAIGGSASGNKRLGSGHRAREAQRAR